MKKESDLRINEKITGVSKVRLVGDNITPGLYSYREAIKIADDLNLDLVEVSCTPEFSVCKVLDYEKYLYNLKKNEKKQVVQEVKEIRFTANTSDHDLEYKTKHAVEFLKDGNIVKAVVTFKGREMNYTDQGQLLLLKLCESLEDVGKTDSLPKLEGKKMSVTIRPKSKK